MSSDFSLKRPHSNLQQFHSEAPALWVAWRRSWAVPVSFKARPFLALCALRSSSKKKIRAFGSIFFLPERAFAIATKVPLRQQVFFLRKRGKMVEILALGPDRSGL